MSGILTQPSSRKQFARRRKRSLRKGAGSYLYINLYYRSVNQTNNFLHFNPIVKFKKTKVIKRVSSCSVCVGTLNEET